MKLLQIGWIMATFEGRANKGPADVLDVGCERNTSQLEVQASGLNLEEWSGHYWRWARLKNEQVCKRTLDTLCRTSYVWNAFFICGRRLSEDVEQKMDLWVWSWKEMSGIEI